MDCGDCGGLYLILSGVNRLMFDTPGERGGQIYTPCVVGVISLDGLLSALQGLTRWRS